MTIHHYKILFCLFLSAWVLPTSALDTLVVDGHFTSASLTDHGYLYKEEDLSVGIEKIRGLPDSQFRPLTETGISFKAENYVHWVKCPIKNGDTTALDLLVEFANPRLNQVRFFLEGENGTLVTSALMGDDFPFPQREIQHRHYLLQLKLDAGESRTLYVMAEKYGENILLDITLHNEQRFWEKDGWGSFWGILYIGFLFCILTFTLIVALFSGKKLMLHFFLYCLFASTILVSWTGFGFQYFWPSFPYFNSICGYLLIGLASWTLLGMTRAYLEVHTHYPRFDRFIQTLQHIIIVYVPLIVGYQFLPQFALPIITNLGNTIILVFAITIITAPVVIYFKSGQKEHLLFLAGFVFVIISLISRQLENIEVTGNNWFSAYFVRFAFLIDFSILMFLIGKQVRNTYWENLRLSYRLGQLKIQAANALFVGQEKERKRLSMELHDGTSIHLATLKMKLSKLKNSLPGASEKSAVDGLISEVTTISKDIRQFTHALAPIDLSEKTLEDAIEDLVFNIESANASAQINLSYQLAANQPTANAANHLFQVVKELLGNALQHAGASEVSVNLKNENGTNVLSVSDNGRGFDPNKTKGGLGLKNIRARATLLDGKVVIKSGTEGTQVVFSFPF